MPIPVTASVDAAWYSPLISKAIESGYDREKHFAGMVTQKSWKEVSAGYKSGVKTIDYIPLREMREKSELGSIEFDRVQAGFLTESEYTEFALATAVSRKARNDETHGIIKAANSSLGNSYSLLQNKQVAAIYNFGSTTTIMPGQDGAALFTTSHPHPNPGVTWTRTNKTATNTALSYDALKEALTIGRRFVNLNGDPASMWKPGSKIILWVGSTIELDALKLVKTVQEPGGDKNDINVLSQYSIQVRCNPYLNGDFCALLPEQVPLLLVIRDGLEAKAFIDDYNDALVSRIYARHGFHPQEIFGVGIHD